MKRIFVRLSVLLLCIVAVQLVKAQQVDSMMAVYQEQYPVEKMHIHFDKSVYNKEETIWYKVYILTGSELSDISRNVYLEWYDTSGRMLKQTVAPLYQATAKGAFELPADYKGDYIHVKAFTRWMLNDDPAFSYERDLGINNTTLSAAVVRKTPVLPKTRLELFPEGGFLVDGINSKVAFKASNQFGNPVFVKAVLADSKNKTIDTLKVQHDGMGYFQLQPQAGESYKVNWTDENGKTGTTAVEGIKQQGVCMAVATTNEKAIVKVERSENVPDNFKVFNILVHMNQQLFFRAQLKGVEKTVQVANIPIEELPTGILQFSLFTADWMPVAERILFVNNHQHEFNAKVLAQLVSLDKRGKNVLDISVSDTAFTNMSIAVTDADVPVDEKNNIFSDILLSGELKGKIYNPAYYLKSDADTVAAHLDLLMLTNGWRRFDWDKIKAGTRPDWKYPVENSLMKMGGKVLDMKAFANAPSPMLNVIMVGKDSSKRFMFLPITRDGSFEDPHVFFYDTVRLYYSFNGANKFTEGTQVQFDNGLLRQSPKKISLGTKDPVTAWSDSLARLRMNLFLTQQEALKKAMAAATLEEVIVRTKAKRDQSLQNLDKTYASGLFSGGDGYSFDMLDDPFAKSALSIFTFLQGRVAGLQISGSGMQTSLSWRGASPDLYINEQQSTVDMVQSVAVTDVAYIKVFRPPFFGSIGGGSGGAIAIYTKKGADARKGSADSKGLENTLLGGYSRFKEFYNPVYDKSNDNTQTDVRTTLYWNPYIITNKKTPRARIEFYNNDISKKLLVVLEGVNGDGKMTRVVKLLDTSTKTE
ncbi:hypothetical protein [Sediminibacterium soli]|uniref:hypothetical protein n=1 Tax=Sediminibacterium soli TaxID=2698829 RepID=UPI00137AD423|nr:hypothetical protein [Sediminibacterium soli]NCI46848.1 hypothetical protein [Sediminibacterium soli]